MNRSQRKAQGLRRLGRAGILLGALLAMDCGQSGDVTGGGGPKAGVDTTGMVPLDPALPVDTLRLATLNMSIGFQVSHLLFINMDIDTVAFKALQKMYAQYAKGYPTERVKAMAREIARESLDVVGLQEVMTLWKSDTLINDFLPELVAAIKAEGGPDYQVFQTVMNDTAMTGRKSDSSITVKFQEGNAILVRTGFTVLDSTRNMYFNLLRLELEHIVVSERGADYLRIRSPKGIEFQVFNTHLEVLPTDRIRQGKELIRLADSLQLKSQRAGRTYGHLQVVLGDLNSAPGVEAHFSLRDTGFVDTHDGPGVAQGDTLTCCVFESNLWDTAADSSVSRRIDYVMARGLVKPLLSRTAVKAHFQTADGKTFLASDHRMVVSHIVAQ